MLLHRLRFRGFYCNTLYPASLMLNVQFGEQRVRFRLAPYSLIQMGLDPMEVTPKSRELQKESWKVCQMSV